MRFTEINLFGVYVAPISVMMVAAWVVTIGLRRFAARFGLLRYVWHPSLFVFAVYMIVLSSMVLVVARAELAMSEVEAKAKREAKVDSPAAVWSPEPAPRDTPRRRLRILPLLITLLVIAVAVVLGRAMWDAYMGAPWTRDGTVRAYVVTMAPQVAGQIVELPVADNQFVHKGDLLMVIDPTNFKIAVSLAEAAVAAGAGHRAERRARGEAPAGTDHARGHGRRKTDLCEHRGG